MNFLPDYIRASKILNRLTVEKNRFWRFLPLKLIINQKIGPSVKNINKEKLQSKLQALLGDFRDFPSMRIGIKTKENLIKWADQTLDHKFEYLGSGLIEVNPIDWHTDFKSGFTWQKGTFYKKYVTTDLSNNADVKVPWELSRCHHLLWLGQAYLITKEEKYARGIVVQIENWIDENQLMRSINWTCAMDVAIRATNWMYAINMISSSEYTTEDFTKKVYRSLYEHGFFIYNNFEKTFPYGSNHYASDIVGMLFISQLFNDTLSGRKWWKFAISEFVYEIRDEILPSGVQFELCTSYHRMITEMFAYSYLMLLRINYPVPVDIRYRIESMFHFINQYTKPNGQSPVIGDNDDGRFLPFYKYDFRDHRYLLSIGSIIFKNKNLKQDFCTYGVDCHFLLGKNSFDKFEKVAVSKEAPSSKIYNDCGFAVLKNDSAYLFINNGTLGRYTESSKKIKPTHVHADLLSFELSIKNEDIIIDPGTYIYTASQKERNEFRSTKKHNTIVVDDNNQYDFSTHNIFTATNNSCPTKLVLSNTEKQVECIAAYQYSKNKLLLEHERIFILQDSNSLIIKDFIKNKNQHTLSIFFHFAPYLIVEIENNSVLISSLKIGKVRMIFSCIKNIDLKIENDSISPSYGVKQKSKTLRINCEFINEFQIESKIEWIM